MSVVYYEGERIYFRPIEPEQDAPLLQQWVNDCEVWPTLGHPPPLSVAREREWLEQFQSKSDQYLFGIVVREQDQLIGTCSLNRIHAIDRSGIVGMMIGQREMQNRGYGTEATRLLVRFGFEELNLNRIELGVFDCNGRAIRAYEKAGFVLEGRHRQAFFRNGRYQDALRYAILREEWERSGEPVPEAAD